MAPAEILALIARNNIVAAVAILAVLALRLPVRRAFGPRLAYALWLAVPLAVAAALIPAPIKPAPLLESRDRSGFPQVVAPSGGKVGPVPTFPDPAKALLALWLAGALAAAGVSAFRQRRFQSLASQGLVGPAVVGVIKPRIILPAEFEVRFSDEERRMILAHEQVHIAAQDSRLNGAVLGVQCLFWFNPLLHLGAHFLRVDQELSCDATVVARFPAHRRAYAEALLKTQLAATPILAGCYWPARAEHPLNERIAMLKSVSPTARRRRAGLLLVASATLAGGYGAWAMQPPRAAPEQVEALTGYSGPPGDTAPLMPPPARVQDVFPATQPPLVDDAAAARRFAAMAPTIETWAAETPDAAPPVAQRPPRIPLPESSHRAMALQRMETLRLWSRLAERDFQETRARHEVGQQTRTDLARADLKRTQVQGLERQLELAIQYYDGTREEAVVGLRTPEELDAVDRELSRVLVAMAEMTDPFR